MGSNRRARHVTSHPLVRKLIVIIIINVSPFPRPIPISFSPMDGEGGARWRASNERHVDGRAGTRARVRHGSLNVDLLSLGKRTNGHKSYTLEIVVQIRLHLSCSLLASAIYYSTKNTAPLSFSSPSDQGIENLGFRLCLHDLLARTDPSRIRIIMQWNSSTP